MDFTIPDFNLGLSAVVMVYVAAITLGTVQAFKRVIDNPAWYPPIAVAAFTLYVVLAYLATWYPICALILMGVGGGLLTTGGYKAAMDGPGAVKAILATQPPAPADTPLGTITTAEAAAVIRQIAAALQDTKAIAPPVPPTP